MVGMPMPLPPDVDIDRRFLLDIIDRAFDKRSWHGANLTSALRGVSPCDALKKPLGRRCVWEQLLHAIYWKHNIVNKLTTPTRFPRKGANWPRLPLEPDKTAWKADLALLHSEHERLRIAIEAMDHLTPQRLLLIQGAAAHDLYHAGQIKLLRRLIVRK